MWLCRIQHQVQLNENFQVKFAAHNSYFLNVFGDSAIHTVIRQRKTLTNYSFYCGKSLFQSRVNLFIFSFARQLRLYHKLRFTC